MSLIEQKGTTVSGVAIEAFTSEDLWASIGAARDQTAFAQRTLALADPAQYEADRSTALEALKDAAAVTFKSTYDSYIAGGFGKAEAKQLATAAAKVNYDFGLKALRANFPSAADNVFQAAATAQGVHLMRGGAPRAPKTAKKKKASKRR